MALPEKTDVAPHVRSGGRGIGPQRGMARRVEISSGEMTFGSRRHPTFPPPLGGCALGTGTCMSLSVPTAATVKMQSPLNTSGAGLIKQE
jgi:hypothetical protein